MRDKPKPVDLVAEAWGLMENGEERPAIPMLRRALSLLDEKHPQQSDGNGRRVVCRTDPRRWWPSVIGSCAMCTTLWRTHSRE